MYANSEILAPSRDLTHSANISFIETLAIMVCSFLSFFFPNDHIGSWTNDTSIDFHIHVLHQPNL